MAKSKIDFVHHVSLSELKPLTRDASPSALAAASLRSRPTLSLCLSLAKVPPPPPPATSVDGSDQHTERHSFLGGLGPPRRCVAKPAPAMSSRVVLRLFITTALEDWTRCWTSLSLRTKLAWRISPSGCVTKPPALLGRSLSGSQ